MQTASPDTFKLPVAQLMIAAQNVRKTPADKASNDELRSSILHHGLIKNLAVIEPETKGDPYQVIAGGRRLAAIQELIDSGDLPADYEIPVNLVRPNGGGAEEISLAENIVRTAMHPADQIETFSRLASAGSTHEEIANRFGVSPITVTRRIALADVAPEVLAHYRAGDIDLQTLKAFTVTSDHSRQVALLEIFKTDPHWTHRISPYRVKSELSNGSISSDDRIARFVGIEKYEAAGGRVDRDLFTDSEEDSQAWFLDEDILRLAANAMLAEEADKLRTEWSWVETSIDYPQQLVHSCQELEPKPGKPTKKQEAELDRIDARLSEIQAHYEAGTIEPDMETEYSDLHEKRELIDEDISAKDKWLAKDRKRAGAVIFISDDIDDDRNHGRICVMRGLVKPEDRKPEPQKASAAPGQSDPAPARTAAAPSDQVAKNAATSPGTGPAYQVPAKQPMVEGVSDTHAEQLGHIRTNIIRNAMLNHPDMAIDYLAWDQARIHFVKDACYSGRTDTSIKAANTRPPEMRGDDRPWSDPAEAEFIDARDDLPLDWTDPAMSDTESFQAFLALDRDQRRAILAYVAASSINPSIAGSTPYARNLNGPLDSILDDIGVDFTTYRPCAKTFWNRVKKSVLLDLVREHLGADRAKGLSVCNKPEIVDFVTRTFGPEKIDPATKDWSVPGFKPFQPVEDTETES